MSEQRPWLWTWWQWQSGSQADAAPGWVLNLVEQSEGKDEPEDTVFHTLTIGAPGGVHVDLGRVSRHPKLERGFATKPPSYQWWMHTNYGTWEVCYQNPERYGRLDLCVYASKHGGDWADLTLWEVSPALIAELSDCLELPPEAWPLRPGWQQKGHTEHVPQRPPREPRPPAAANPTTKEPVMSPEQPRPIAVPGLFYLLCERLGFDHGFIWTWWRALASSADDLRFSIELFSCHLDDTDDNMHFLMERFEPSRFLHTLDSIAQDQTLAPEDIERIRAAISHNVDTNGLWLRY